MDKRPLIIVIGAYGSGKSEYSINLARKMKKDDEHICLVDLDVVNPYFRSRDVREEFEKEGIEVVAPEAGYGLADLPMISPRVQGSISDTSKTVILDVGGDPAGCKVLRRFEDAIKERTYQMLLVVNTRRPFTSTVDEIIEMKNSLESISRLKVTELICNANLMEFTQVEMITDAIGIIHDVAKQENLTFNKYLVLNDTEGVYPEEIDGIQKVDLHYYLKKPWES